MSSRKSNSSKSSLLSSFNWQDKNLKSLLKPIPFTLTPLKNPTEQPFNHHTHKNLHYTQAPFLRQQFLIQLQKLTNVKHIRIENFTHGAEMTVSIAQKDGSEFVEVYRDKYICKGRMLRDQEKLIELGALPCKVVRVSVTKGCKVAGKNISLIGIDCQEIESQLGVDYFRLLVINPMKIIYPDI